MQQTEIEPPESRLIDLRKDLDYLTDRYIPYLKDNIKLGMDMEWVNTARDYPQLLNFFPPHPSPFESYGTTDVAVVLRSAVRAKQPEKGLLVLFDINVNGDMDEDAHGKALIRLTVANFKSPDTRPIVVQTNMKDKWHLFWMDGDKVIEEPLPTNSHAAWLVQTLLSGRMGEYGRNQVFAERQRIPERLILRQRRVELEVTNGGRGLHIRDI
ncbi:g8701 [Coccomyxa viridis]|uniref:G8701 protein n=1 Tax=Coccomyxa viridis TaxID=1274662 RepID=A0ABP1G3E5_9CHLO